MQVQDIKVLLIEDNPGDVRLIREALLRSRSSNYNRFILEHTDHLYKGIEMVSNNPVDVILLDLTLPDSTGFETFNILREKFPDEVIVVLSGIDDEELAMKIVQSGAQDFLVKGYVNDILLARAIKYALERKQSQQQIKASLKEKEILLKEVHHRVKNNLQVISSLLSLQSNYITDKKILQLFIEGQNRVKSIALIHEKLYQTEDLGKIIFKDYVSSLIGSLLHSYGITPARVSTRIDISDICLNIDTAIPCGLIINELVSNSLKYAFPRTQGQENGSIYIMLKQQEEPDFSLIIGDNGVGFPNNVNYRQTETLGLQLVNTLVDQLEGTIELSHNQGTEYKINFAELKYRHN